MEVVYHPSARDEVVEAVRFYESREERLGARFLDEFEAAVMTIAEHPARWPVVEAGVRRYLLRRFPYSILYAPGEDCITIYAVKHHSRQPSYWLARLR